MSIRGDNWTGFARQMDQVLGDFIWVRFAYAVHQHIEDYTVPQYGDHGEDLATNYTKKDCMNAVAKYKARRGRNAREGQAELDEMKIVHYLQMAVERGHPFEYVIEDCKEARFRWGSITMDKQNDVEFPKAAVNWISGTST